MRDPDHDDPLAAAPPQPTERELDVLQVLWRRGPSTPRQVLDALGDRHEAGYTSLQKIMTIMLDKGLVERRSVGRAHRYRALVPREAVRRSLAGDLLERAFGGSVAALLQSALAARPASADEREAVAALLADAERAADSDSGSNSDADAAVDEDAGSGGRP